MTTSHASTVPPAPLADGGSRQRLAIGRGADAARRALAALALSCLATTVWAQAPPPPPPPPSSSSTVGQTVTNPVTGATTQVAELLVDPAGTPTAGTIAFVRTADGYAFLVKSVGQFVYNSDTPPLRFQIVSIDTTAHTAQFDADPPGGPLASLSTQLLYTTLHSELFGTGTPGVVTPPVVVSGASGVRVVGTGNGGSNGRDGALFVPPGSGGRGQDGPTVTYTNTTVVSATNQIGFEVGSVGGRGGDGGDSYLSFWSGRDGGDGGAGGTVNATNATGVQIATTGNDAYGVFAYSRSGAAGNGGSGFAAPGGGTGGHSSDGGSVTFTNHGTVSTTGAGAFGIYGLSVSNNGGNGGSQWGLVGQSGSGGFGGSGGPVDINNSTTGSIFTSGTLAHGILAQSIGGSGGSSGTSGNLLVSLNGSPDNGGNGGTVTVNNNGSITTTGAQSRGIFAQSIGGGGGTGGSAGGLIALGGSGSNGGSASTVTARNSSTGSITTTGVQSDGIFAQSVGGSGGSGSNAGGLVAIGGSGANAGNGGAVTVENYGSITTTNTASRGVVAQSIGGGGGDGGNSGGLVSVGGSGAGGGNSSTVTVRHGGSITTQGGDSAGIFAQSVGGGGGNGGSSGSVGLFAGVAIGGSGGGGAGGNVSLTLQGQSVTAASLIRTSGPRSTGIFAQSVGGGGGNGGGAVQVSAGIGAASIAIGGSGGNGGAGGTVNVTRGAGLSLIETSGSDSAGAFLQSVGGGGGNGGYAVAVAVSGGPVSGSLGIALGGSGGSGGIGGAVNVGAFTLAGDLISTGLNGSILTRGERSPGLVAQSVGGGGGNGGLGVAAAGSGSLFASGSVGISLGGKGGGGGAGGNVSVGVQGNVTTEQANSTGMLVQSVGGGGGNGGGSVAAALSGSGGGAGSVSVALGGSGGMGGIGGTVIAATRSGTVTTGGEHSAGIVVQSVGGGGGNGGFSVAGSAAGAGIGAGGVSVGLGGTAGGGGNGGIVRADLQSDVSTSGQNSTGILVQSVGGGGGNGGMNVSVAGAGAGVGSGAITVGLGGSGGDGGLGGSVSASSTGTIVTTNDRSAGFIAQSIGGGGGNGGFNISGSGSGAGVGAGGVSIGLGGTAGAGNHAGTVIASSSGDVSTAGDQSIGILAQSVGGGGGNGGFNISATGSGAGVGSGAVSVGLGGSAGGGGSGSTVDLTVTNDVSTEGSSAGAVIAQSIGGGGGTGGFNVTVAGSGAGTGSGAVGVGLGGSGGAGGNAARVTSTMAGDITTLGHHSTGLLVQSVGGGGGNGGFNVSAALSGAGTGSGTVAVGLGGSGGSGGTSGAVASDLTGDVSTRGNYATGVTAQSIGGGGGNGGFNVSGTISAAGTGSAGVGVGLGGSGGGGGVSGTVSNAVTGDVVTTGIGSGGVLAQSLGGGGGAGGFNISGAISAAKTGSGAISVGVGGSGGLGGHSATVTNTVTGRVFTGNADAFGILAQSVGGGGGNGGMNVSGSISAASSAAGAIAVGIGGAGGGGGDAASVTNTITGYVQTMGVRSAGITTQSLGGGGGNGGLNVSGTLSAAKTASGGLAVGVGGLGGDGGDGATATSTVTGGVVTTGDSSIGILTQSLGGGGGNGGLNVSGAVSLSKQNGGSLGVGVGGFGGGGGNAGTVSSTVTTTAALPRIATTGRDASAIVAQSIGGGGGNGGLNVSASVNLSGSSGAAIGVGVGGFGGGAGNAGNVALTTTGDVVTFGHDSNGLMAQSIGGGGGNGGINVAGTLALLKPSSGSGTTVAASIGVGGFGGGGGRAGTVGVDYRGSIVALPRTEISPAAFTLNETEGAHGLVAQSIGGGGGNGGLNVSGGVSYGAKDADGHALLVGVGGFGGVGGNAGAVDVNANGPSITAYGNGRSGILASSIGGGGGAGGLNVSGGIASDSPLIVGVGGMGGNGGTGGNVTVNATTDLLVGSQAGNTRNGAGLMAQSLGGGGGDGGLNVSGGISFSKEKNIPSVTFGIGGFGGAGAVSGSVAASHTGTITTAGGWTHGIFAQSIAGGGGNGALNVTGEFNWADSKNSGGKTDLTIVAGLGGHGGDGADSGSASVVSQGGTITTTGDYARGIFAQSIGGGGGTGGMNVTGVFAKNSSPVSIGVGGFGGGGGNAGAASVTRGSSSQAAGKITTSGVGAIGIEATSIGGGGGDAGMNFQVGISLAGGSSGGGSGGGSTPREHPKHTGVDDSVFTNYDKVLDELEGKAPTDSEDSTDASKESAFAAQIVIGGAGGDAGSGGGASVNNRSNIETRRDYSHGIMAQSIGGGGGNATLNLGVVYEGKSDKNKGFNLAVGGAPGNAGSGGAVTVSHEGTVETFGKASYGVLAQSIGGGGGNAGLDVAYSKTNGGKIGISIGRTGGTGGAGGDVALISNGTVTTHGASSYGLLAQSVGNGGGNSSSTAVSITVPADGDTPERAASVSVGLEGGLGGRAGNVTLNASGLVTTLGEDSHAIFAQSIGGGGGNGGSATGLAVNSSTAAVSVGGTGGQGGTGGSVDVISSADVRTSHNRSVGLLAQSIGGAGGSGGMAKAGGVQKKGSGALISVGGSGGSGMSSGRVTVDNSGIVITDGESSHGVLAQSIGGGGGEAGMVINTIVNRDAAEATQLNVSVGGSGGDGAVSGDVRVTNSGGIGTAKQKSAGIFAQAIGGGGGNANQVITGSISTQGAGNKISLGIGGSGGTGGAAGNVSVVNQADGRIITTNHYSPGILAMSVGGGGGTGSTTITSNRAGGVTAETKSTSVAFSLGGAGGTGGTGGTVTVDNAGSVTTYGYKSHGIVAMSVGGGGGSGGTSIAGDLSIGGKSTQNPDAKISTFSIGGFGGDGNRAGNVRVTNSGNIVVNGDNAYGIYAQSVGGGGGDGGFTAAISKNVLANPKTDLLASALNMAVGGSGGDGGDGGNVVVNHTGSITSNGKNAYGIFAQSVGGGGGSVGTSISSPIWTAADLAISAIVGGRDGASGQAGTVTVNTTGNITMNGANSQAQFTQAVSGGGGDLELFLDISRTAVGLGDGGFVLPNNDGILEKAFALIDLGTEKLSDAVGTAIDATHVGDLYTWGEKSIASLVQTIGGGGGNADTTIVLDEGAKIDLEVALGAKQTNNSSGGDVALTRSGDVLAAGANSQGVSVQSVGGGGGRLRLDVANVAAEGVGSAGASTSRATVGLGADPSFVNNGGSLALDLTGNTVTAGNYSPGLVLQSIGAGGGQAYLSGLAGATINIGATDGSTGSGGNIHLSNTGSINTVGRLSDGIVLQSIGGGGGYVLTDLPSGGLTVNRRSDNAGDGGDIDYTQVGNIVVRGDRSRGVVAQSIGGGGGIVDGAFFGSSGGAGNGGSIDLRLHGDVIASGLASTAVLAQSLGRSAGDINISLAPGTTVAGAVGVVMDGGSNNTLLNRSFLSSSSGFDGFAVTGTTGNDTVDNFGTIAGSFDLGSGANQLTNESSGSLMSGRTLNLGIGTLTNAGTLDPGGRSMMRTTVIGRFAQRGRPTWLMDIGEAGDSDGVIVFGTADLFDSVTTVNLADHAAPRSSGTYTLLSTAGGLSGAKFNLGTMFGEMPIGQTFTLEASDRTLDLNLRPSTGTFYWKGAVSNTWSDPFVNGRSNWTRQPDGTDIFGTPGAGSDVIFEGSTPALLGADFTIGSLAGTGILSLSDKTLTTGATGASTTWAGTIAGSGTLVKTGTGTFTLSGANAFEGRTTVAGGRLLVHGWLGGRSVRVLNGALLGGHGTVPGVTIERGGTLAPGASIGALTIVGDATFEAGSTYQVETSRNSSDLAWMTGSLFGSGATVQVLPGGDEGYRPITTYGIIRAPGARSGVFSNVTSSASYLNPSLQYDSNGLSLTLRRTDVDFRSTGTRGNQTRVASSLNGLVATATGQMAQVINTVYEVSNDRAVRAIGSMTGVVYQYTVLSGFAGAQTFMDVNMARLGHLANRAATSSATLAFNNAFTMEDPSRSDGQGAWLSGVGGFTRYSGTDVDPAARASSPGFAAGYDAAIGRHLVLGGSLADSSPDLTLEGVSDGTVASMLHTGVYGRYKRGASRVAATIGFSGGTNKTARAVTDGVALSIAQSEYDGDSRFARVEYGHTLPLARSLSFEALAGYQHARVGMDAFVEDGAGALNLSADQRRASSRRSIVGGRAVKTFTRGSGAETILDLRAAWAHEFNPLDSMTMRFEGDNASNEFHVESPALLHNSALVGASVGGRMFKAIRFFGSVDGDLSGPIKLWTASIGLRAGW